MKTKNIYFALLTSVMLVAMGTVSTGCKRSADKSAEVSVEEWLQTVPESIREVPGITKFMTKTDYANASNWVVRPDTIDKDVDLIYYYPTTYFSNDLKTEAVADIDNEGMVAGARRNVAMNTPAYEEQCNVFAPLYRQMDVNYANEMTPEAFNALVDFGTAQDPEAALDYYFEHLNQGRPFIIAGHSQGSTTTLKLLATYFREHQDLLKRMVAAYPIGYSVTDRYLKENTHLKFAEGADDTGVIVSWNTEGKGNKEAKSLVVEPGAISINPLNWKRDATPAAVGENHGSRVNGEPVPGIADARIDLERGVVIVTTEAAKPYAIPADMQAIFGPESYHGMDYGFFYQNLKENVATRCKAYRQ